MLRHRLTDDHWEVIEDLFPKPARTGRPPRDPRVMVDAILWVLRTGSPWRDVPEELAPWQTVWHHFDRWNASGLLDEILNRLRAAHVDVGAIDDQLWCVDGTVGTRGALRRGGWKKSDPDEPADHALGRSRGGFSTKIHLLCDRHGHPLHFHLTPGQTHESRYR